MPIFFLFLLMVTPLAVGQSRPVPLDPTRDLGVVAEQPHTPLPEQYIWTAGDVTVRRTDRSKFPWSRTEVRVAPHFFRTHFDVKQLPHSATVYVAGPREAKVYLNGKPLGEFASNPDAPINFRVFHADAAAALKAGDNLLAIEAVRGRGVVSGAGPIATQQLAYGEAMVAKVVPAAFGMEAPALTITDGSWRSSATSADHWEESGYDDSAWPKADALGGIESNVDFFQWSADAGMYGWPGYRGMSPHLQTYALQPAAILHVFAGQAKFEHLDALTANSGNDTFSVTYANASGSRTDAESPQILLDFGREVAGRLYVESASDQDGQLSIAYGESELEAMATGLTSEQQGGNYLGTSLIDVPAHGVARGPKSGFRYVRIRFLHGARMMRFKAIRLEGIYEPVTYLGSFESSDPLLNRIWETGAYTAHLCMQDGVWDAVKRDRGRWVGDIDVEGRVISTVFGESELLKDTLRRLAAATSPTQHVNGIASYSALWVTSLDDLYRHTGDQAYLASEHGALLQILARMDADLDASGEMKPDTKGWGFVDWAPGLYGVNAATRTGTHLQFLRGYAAGARLLNALGDTQNAARYAPREKSTIGDAGLTWQINSLAVLEGADKAAAEKIWDHVLSHVKQDEPSDQVISPYFGMYLLDAMAKLDHRDKALDWIRAYWGGMLAEGATSFWESYDLRWPKNNPHLSLQADGTSGYFVSLAHGWSAGPTVWLSENVLGITPAAPGYTDVEIAPHLLGLAYARGAVPTPHGAIAISLDAEKGIEVDLPTGVRGHVDLTGIDALRHGYFLDGAAGSGDMVEIAVPGHHRIQPRSF